LNEETTLHKGAPGSALAAAAFRLQHVELAVFPDRASDFAGDRDSFAHALGFELTSSTMQPRACPTCLKLTRFEAVRRNKPVCFLMQQSGSTWILGTDLTCTGTLDTNGRQQAITEDSQAFSRRVRAKFGFPSHQRWVRAAP